MLLRARSTFHAPGPVTVDEGTIVEDTDELAVKYPAMFEPVAATRSSTERVVDATARPGEKRGAVKASR